MKNILKISLIFIIIIMLTGCSGNYNMKINADLSVEEDLELSIDNEEDTYDKTLKIFENNDINKDKYSVNISSDKVIIKYKDSFSSIEDYILNSKVYSQVFDNISYNKTKNYVDLYTNQNLKQKNKYNLINGTNLNDYDVIQINISNPFKVNYTNAEMINDNIYTWSLTKDNIQKIIHMQFKPSFNEFPYRPVIVGLLILTLTSIFIFRIVKKYFNTQRF